MAGRPKGRLASCDGLALGPCKRTLGMPAGSAVGKSGRPPQSHLRAMPLKLRRRGGPGERLGTLRHCRIQGSAGASCDGRPVPLSYAQLTLSATRVSFNSHYAL